MKRDKTLSIGTVAILWVGRYPVRDFTMYIHRRAEQRSGKLAGNYD